MKRNKKVKIKKKTKVGKGWKVEGDIDGVPAYLFFSKDTTDSVIESKLKDMRIKGKP